MHEAMRTIGFEVTNINAERFVRGNEPIANVRMENNITVTSIDQPSDKAIAVRYRFTVGYERFGVIRLEGVLHMDGDDAAPTAEEWRTKGTMSDEAANVIHNTIMTNCVPPLILISREVRLPPPVPIPRINVQKYQAASARPVGPEFA